MNLLRILPSVVIAGHLFGLVLLMPGHSIAGEEIDDHILDAYMSDPDVVGAISQFRERGYVDGGPRSVAFSSLCGVAGCGYSVLIVHSFGSTGANPRTSSILTLVRLDPFDEVTSVKLMELKPIATEPRIGGRILAPSPRLRVEDKIPAPSPELRIKERIPAPHPEISPAPSGTGR